MFNDRLSSEVANELIKERTQEAESYSLQKRLGYRDETAKWVVVLVIVVVAVVVGWLI